MKHKGLLMASAFILVAAAFVLVTWSDRGFIPILQKSSIDLGNALPQVPSGTSSTTKDDVNATGMPLSLPQGFSVSLFAKGLGAPRDLVAVSNGSLLASVPSKGKVLVLEDANRDGVAEVKTLLTGLNQPHGLAISDGMYAKGITKLYVAETDALSEYDYDTIHQTASHRKVLTALPGGGGHTTRSILLDPQGGGILVSIGATCNACNESDPKRGAVYRYDFAKNLLEPYASGLRNAVFLATQYPEREVWVTEMGRDNLGDDAPPDELDVLTQGKNYGWPNCYGKNVHDTDFDHNTSIRNPCMEPFETPSKIDLEPHSSPLGLTFIPTNPEDGWPQEYRGDLLVAYHGSWNRTVPTGYKIRRFKLDLKGDLVKEDDFMTGWLTREQEVLGRPVDVEFGFDGVLYISDDKIGVIYRVVPTR